MSFNLIMLNLWIGFCRGVAGLPKDLRNLGYQDKWIEWRFINQDRKEVCPDLIIASEQVNHTLLLEFKGGANTEPEQLRRYSRVTAQDLVDKAFMTRRATNNHDFVVVGQGEHGERLRMGIDNSGYSFPLLLADHEGLVLDHNQFQISQLNSIFFPKLGINWNRVPSNFVPLNGDSALWEVAEKVIPKVLEYMLDRRPHVSMDEISRDICITWDIMGRQPRNEIKAKVRKVLREAASRHFKAHLRWIGPRDRVEIVANPLELQSDKRTATYRNLLTAQKRLIESLRTGPTRDDGEQLALPYS